MAILTRQPEAYSLQSTGWKARDRLAIALSFALLIHGLVIFGVGFDYDDELPIDLPITMEVTLVTEPTEQSPDKADFLAQSNQVGGGEPAAVSTKPSKNDIASQADVASETAVMNSSANVLPSPQQRATEVLTADATEPDSQSLKKKQEERPWNKLTGASLFSQSLKSARYGARSERERELKTRNPRHKFISAHTREYKYASYLESWHAKVVRIGNINYPEEAKTQNLSGSLLLDVALNQDGTIYELKLLRSSGSDTLDNAAKKIVRLAGPFAPLPVDISKDTDVLHIIRTWQFLNEMSVNGG